MSTKITLQIEVHKKGALELELDRRESRISNEFTDRVNGVMDEQAGFLLKSQLSLALPERKTSNLVQRLGGTVEEHSDAQIQQPLSVNSEEGNLGSSTEQVTD